MQRRRRDSLRDFNLRLMGRGSCWAVLCDNNSRRELGEWEHCASPAAIILLRASRFTSFTGSELYVYEKNGV